MIDEIQYAPQILGPIKQLVDAGGNIPTAEHQALLGSDAHSPVPVAYERRNRDLTRVGLARQR